MVGRGFNSLRLAGSAGLTALNLLLEPFVINTVQLTPHVS